METLEKKTYSTFDIRKLEDIAVKFVALSSELQKTEYGKNQSIAGIEANLQNLNDSLGGLYRSPKLDRDYKSACEIAATIAGKLTHLIEENNFTIAQIELLKPMSEIARQFCDDIGPKLGENNSTIEKFYSFKEQVEVCLGRKAHIIPSGTLPYENLKTEDHEEIQNALRDCLSIAVSMQYKTGDAKKDVALDKIISLVSDKRKKFKNTKDDNSKSAILMSAVRDVLRIKKPIADYQAFHESTPEEQKAIQEAFENLKKLMVAKTVSNERG